MTDYALKATFRLREEIGQGGRRELVLVRHGSGDHKFISLATERPLEVGFVFQAWGTAYPLTRQRGLFEGWEADPVTQ